MISLSDIRTAIQDLPKPVPPNSSPPETLGIGDGVTTVFFLRERPLTTEPIAVYFGSTSGGFRRFTQVPPAGPAPWSLSANAYGATSIIFATPPAQDVVVGARYSATMFSDADLLAYQRRADSYPTDRQTLLGITADLIGAMLLSDDKMRIYTWGDTKSDPSTVRAALVSQQAQIRAELTQSAATSGPAAVTGSYRPSTYIR